MATPRVCIMKNCHRVFGCVYHGIKFDCKTCGDYGKCLVKVKDKKEVTGGICDDCFAELMVERRRKHLTGG